MVRISMEEREATLRLKIEGRLSGAWVAELEECWRSYAARSPHKRVIVDLTDTGFIDLAGKYLLRLMHQSGVAITARTPYMKELAAEIAGADLLAQGKKS
jgi:anti-anti-sigma regulatory factor